MSSRKSISMMLGWVLSACVVVILVLFCSYLYASWQRSQDRIGGYSTAISTLAIRMHMQDFADAPSDLHIAFPDVGNIGSVNGIKVHYIQMDPSYTSEARYRCAINGACQEYNLITLGQACSLALEGEDSPRVRFVLEIANAMYRGSYEAELLERYDRLLEGDEDARALFRTVFANETSGASSLQCEHARNIMDSRNLWDTPEPQKNSSEGKSLETACEDHKTPNGKE